MTERAIDPDHWLLRLSPRGWIDASLAELSRAKSAFAAGDARAGTVAAKRAAGMSLNAVLILFPDEAWGRTYLEHVKAAGADPQVPEAVREAARSVLATTPPGAQLVTLRSRASDERTIEAARTVMAFALSVVMDAESAGSTGPSS